MKLLEVKKSQLVSRSRSNPRFNRRLRSKVSNNTRDYQLIDMNKLFKKDILEVGLPVKGETDDYVVTISYEGVIATLKQYLKTEKLELRLVVKALVSNFNNKDVFINCGCPDFQYRFNFWSTVNRFNANNPEMRPSKITNPDDNLGSTCKHGQLILNNTGWALKVASVINNYIKFMKLRNRNLYDKIISPALYDVEPEEDINKNQLSIFDEEPVEEQPTKEQPGEVEDEQV